MATVAIDANAVGQLITYVAPGFLARLGYRTRYPGPDKPPGEVLIVSVVASFPLVTVVRAALPGTHAATQPGYVALLLVLGWVLGYALSVNVRRDAHHRGIYDLEGENGERRRCWRRVRMELGRLRLLPPAAKAREA